MTRYDNLNKYSKNEQKFWKGTKVRIMKRNLFFNFMEVMEAAKEGLKNWKEETFNVECPDEEIETEFALTEFTDTNTKQLDLFFASDITDEKVVVKFKIEDAENAWHETEDKITEAVENWMRETNLVSNEWVDFN